MAELLKVAKASGEKRANVVFFHGLGGDLRATWMADKRNEASFWPAWLAEDNKNLSVYSVGYDAAVSRWRGHAMHLPDRAGNILAALLTEPGFQKGPLILIGHSLGGLVIKQVLRTADSQAKSDKNTADLLDRVGKVAFLATPHTGSQLATAGDWLRIFLRPTEATACLVRNDPNLRDLNLWYRDWANDRRIDHLILTETRPYSIAGMVVKPDSADPGLGVSRPVPIDCDHVAITKLSDRKHQVYRSVLHFISHDVERPAGTSDLAEGQSRIESKLEEVVRAVRETSGVPLETLRAILREMGEFTESADVGEITLKLSEKAKDYRALEDRLNRLSNADPEVTRLRRDAAEALKEGRFTKADAALAAAEARDLAGLEDIEALAKQKRLSAAESRAERAAAALLRVNPNAYREAAAHYAEAANIAMPAEAAASKNYARQQGEVLLLLGQEFGLNVSLQEAIEHFSGMLRSTKRANDPLEWARTQNILGNALSMLGTRESGTARLEEAVSAFRAALEEFARDRVPLDWAMTQNNLGITLRTLGERESGTARLEEAVAAYRDALEERTRERVPLDWAATQNNLGAALRALGSRESGTARLEEAVAAHRAALEEFNRARVPLSWAGAQNNLGTALWALGERNSGTARLEEAVAAYRAALEEYTRELVPPDWAMIQNNLGAVLRALGERESGTTRLEEAVEAYRAALEEYTRERFPFFWAQTKENLAIVYSVFFEKTGQPGHLADALAAVDGALEEYRKVGAAFYIKKAERLRGEILAAQAI